MGIKQATDNLLNRWLLDLARKRGLLLKDDFHFEGIIRFRTPPFEDEEEWRKWWLPEIIDNKIVRAARMSEREKDRYTAAVSHNILTTNGRTYILTYIGAQTTGTAAFSQYFGVGNTAINTLSPGDTLLQGEITRGVPSTSTITGTQVDVSTFFGSAIGNFTYTNAGLWGVNATATLASGTLMTHALASFTKTSAITLSSDYLINLT